MSQISDLAYSYFGLVGPVTVRTAGAIRMLRQLLVSIAVSVCNIAIHAIVMAAVLWAARVASERAMSHRSFRLIAIMTATVSVLMVAHIAEVVVWTFCLRNRRCCSSWYRPYLFCLRKLHNAWLRRRDSVTALGIARANDGDERRAVVWLVDRRHFCGPAGSDDEPDRRRTATEGCIIRVMHRGVLAARRVT